MNRGALVLVALALAGCNGNASNTQVLERITSGPACFTVEGQGTLRSSKATPMTVPGTQWAQRQLIWMVDEGSVVKEGDVVARFSAKLSELELSTALVDLQRTALSRAAKEAELGDSQGKLQVDLSQVAELLGIARRYANVADIGISRNTILDAVQDEHFLSLKQNTLTWRQGLSSRRGAAELALIDAQRATNDIVAQSKRSDLEALELRAPHAGIVIFEPDWSGQEPHVGANLWAGNTFANLPDTQHMEVEIAIPQSEAMGIKLGQPVELSPVGEPAQQVESVLTWIAAAPAPRSRESPVKYLTVKASVAIQAIDKYHWVPGQDFSARIVLLKADHAITVPNIALASSGDTTTVSIFQKGQTITRDVRIGVRGPSRTQTLDGLEAGEVIVIARRATQGAAAVSPVPAK